MPWSVYFGPAKIYSRERHGIPIGYLATDIHWESYYMDSYWKILKHETKIVNRIPDGLSPARRRLPGKYRIQNNRYAYIIDGASYVHGHSRNMEINSSHRSLPPRKPRKRDMEEACLPTQDSSRPTDAG